MAAAEKTQSTIQGESQGWTLQVWLKANAQEA